MADGSSTIGRLDDQIAWYDKKSVYCQRAHKGLKVTEIVAAAAIPVMSTFSIPPGVLGAVGALIVALEGVQHLNQYHHNWIAYRSTAEALKHEKYLHAGKAGPYANARNPNALLAERVESLVSEEHAKWVSAREAGEREKGDIHGA